MVELYPEIAAVLAGESQGCIVQGDSRAELARLPDRCVHCVVTSPPYWGLRDYQVGGQLGLEKTPEEYVAILVAICREVRRVLRDDGTFWLVIGDSYNSNQAGKSAGGFQGHQVRDGIAQAFETGKRQPGTAKTKYPGGKAKDLIGIPWRVAFALQADGWYLRQDIIWHKPNPMPESVRDRCTKAHEYIFLLAKSVTYYYDAEAIKEPAQDWGTRDRKEGSAFVNGTPGRTRQTGGLDCDFLERGRNKRSVWTVTTKPYKGAHFATFPPDLIEPCILAGTSEKGCCPTCGAPWRRIVQRVRRATRPGEDTKIKQPGRNSRVFQDRDPAHSSERKQRDDYRDPLEIGNRDPERHVTETATLGWRPQCDCYDGRYRQDFHETKHRRKFNQKLSWWARVKRTPVFLPWPLAACIVLDPFMGAGTTGVVCKALGRRYIGIDLNAEYVKKSQRRIARVQAPLFSPATAPYAKEGANG